jgi:hypothetical protein
MFHVDNPYTGGQEESKAGTVYLLDLAGDKLKYVRLPSKADFPRVLSLIKVTGLPISLHHRVRMWQTKSVGRLYDRDNPLHPAMQRNLGST